MTGVDDRSEACVEQAVSAVILCYNAEQHIGDCIRNLAATLSSFPGSEVMVIENGSTDRSRHILKELESEYPELLQVIYLDRNIGTTRSRNIAFDRAKNPYFLVLDADAKIDCISLRKLVKVLEDEPDCGIAAPRINYPDGRYQLSCDHFPTLWNKTRRLIKLRKIEAESCPPTRRQDVDYAISAVWVMRRTILEAVGKLDENIFYSPEDVDYCMRVWIAGLRVVCEPEAVAVHDARELSRSKKVNLFLFRHAAGLIYFFCKYRYIFKAPDVRRRRCGYQSASNAGCDRCR